MNFKTIILLTTLSIKASENPSVTSSTQTQPQPAQAQMPAITISQPTLFTQKPNLASGTPGTTSGRIKIFTSLPTTGGAALIGMDILSGMTLVVNKTNSESTLGKRTIELLDSDNQNESAQAIEQVNKFSAQTNLSLCLFAPDSIAELLDISRRTNLAILFPISGDARLRSSTIPNCFNFRASLEQEIYALINYCALKAQKKKIAIFYEDSAWGEQALGFAKQALKALSIEPKGIASYPANTVEILNAINDISKAAPNAVLCLSNARPTYNFIIQALKRGLKNCKFLGLGEMVPNQDILSKSRGIDLVTSSVVPSPFKSQLAIAQEYRQDMAKYFANKNLSQFSFEGYIATRILVEVLKNIPGEATLEKIRTIIQGLDKYNFGGLSLTFNPKTRSLQRGVWINTGEKDDWEMVYS